MDSRNEGGPTATKVVRRMPPSRRLQSSGLVTQTTRTIRRVRDDASLVGYPAPAFPREESEVIHDQIPRSAPAHGMKTDRAVWGVRPSE